MNRLILSGGGNEKQTFALDEIFLKNIKKILYIPLAWKNGDFQSCLKWFKNMISIHKKLLKISMLTDFSKPVRLEDYDAVYIGGGNTFKLLEKIKDSRFDHELIEYYQHGGTIYGGSAGAIIFGADINTASLCKDADVNQVGLEDTSGLNLVNNLDIQCHFEDNQIGEHQEYIRKTRRSVIAIPEESALLIENNKIRVIGGNPVTLITLSQSKKFKPGEEIKL